MKYLDEYRDPAAARRLANAIRACVTREWTIMEVCGGQTHAILRFGIDQVLPEGVTLVHGPGCPVCVTPVELVDASVQIARTPNTILCTFGDMLRVPGRESDLMQAKAQGADVRMVYSPLDAVALAQKHPDKQVVFFAVGFETTAPANAMAVYQAARQNVSNFSILTSQVLVLPAMEAILAGPGCRVQGFLAAGHVCAVTGFVDYAPLAKKYQCPIVVTGFEPLDILQGVHRLLKQLEEGRAEVENAYPRAVPEKGNPNAMEVLREVFTVVPRNWRGVGQIPDSGLGLAEAYQSFDALQRFNLPGDTTADPAAESRECISGAVLQGLKKPHECPAFGTRCTPEHPLGATMVSTEGACAAYYKYRAHAAHHG